MRTPKEETELVKLLNAIADLLDGYDTTVALAALNFTMGQLIRDCYGGDEGALRLSDEQTRFVAQALDMDDERSN